MKTSNNSAYDSRSARVLERVEALYLIILRAAVLLLATIVLVWGAWLGVSALTKIMRSPDSIVEKPVRVSPAELGDASAPDAPKSSSPTRGRGTMEQRRYYQSFVTRYFRLYQNSFEPFRRPEDKSLDKGAFDDAFVQTEARLTALGEGGLDFDKDRADLEALLQTMEASVNLPRMQSKLKAYKTAQKRPVQRRVERARMERRRGWDSLSTNCESWFEAPIGCSVTRLVSVPYIETVTTMALPTGLTSPVQLFRSMQDRYFTLLRGRREEARSSAASQREDVVTGIAAGRAQLGQMLWVFGGFLILMFFFLLIAIERHQRGLERHRRAGRDEVAAI